MPPAYVKPYVKRGKTDAVDAEAICEAVTRPSSKLVRASGSNAPGERSEAQNALRSCKIGRDPGSSARP